MNEKDYVSKLEHFIEKLLEPIKNLPFSILIKSITKYEIIPFDMEIAEQTGLLERLKKACMIACKVAYDKGIEAKRINEVGNYIEPFMINALNKVGMKAGTPLAQDGKRKSSGYPDIYVEDIDKTPFYLECKTYNKTNINSSFRTFYVSPSPNPKITIDAHHLMVGFEIKTEKRDQKTIYVPVYWKLYSLESLKGQIKHEFNASNKELYSLPTKILEGDSKKSKKLTEGLEGFF
ncbi:MAG: restriction endonuclease [Candidatus Heimdallarchaeota archaeon]|nr:restriction endonuclease [Candidatus Heimdallarchaeota archaeon]MCK4609543.1 restriction endonuclease [Candidatus Heimdallarchaeota archaeon]